MNAERSPSTVHDRNRASGPKTIAEYLRNGDHTDGVALYEALMNPNTRIGDEQTSEMFGDLPMRTVGRAINYADIVAPIDYEAVRIAERARRLAAGLLD